MKCRQGFVSNSSSCSFVIGKAHMTKEQVDKFDEFIDFIEEFVESNFDNLSEALDVATFTNITKEDVKNSIKREREMVSATPANRPFYFLGTIDQNDVNIFIKFLETIGVDQKYIESYM